MTTEDRTETADKNGIDKQIAKTYAFVKPRKVSVKHNY